MKKKNLILIIVLFLILATGYLLIGKPVKNENGILHLPQRQEILKNIQTEYAKEQPEGQEESDEQQEEQASLDNSNETEDQIQPQIHFDVDLDSLKGLSNESLSWGPGTNADEDNRPIGSISYQEKYGQYDADFIAANTKQIYLTIDEGYENGYTPVIMDVLKEKEVSAVFFVTMDYVKSEPELIRRMIEEGHVVGAHSVSHPSKGMPSLSLEAQLNELRELHEYIKQEYDYEMYLFRYPAGIFSEQSLALVQATGYRSVFWSFAYQDWIVDDQPTPEAAMKKIMGRLHPGAIYLLHAVSSTNAQVMGDFIDQARSLGYEFAKYEYQSDRSAWTANSMTKAEPANNRFFFSWRTERAA